MRGQGYNILAGELAMTVLYQKAYQNSVVLNKTEAYEEAVGEDQYWVFPAVFTRVGVMNGGYKTEDELKASMITAHRMVPTETHPVWGIVSNREEVLGFSRNMRFESPFMFGEILINSKFNEVVNNVRSGTHTDISVGFYREFHPVEPEGSVVVDDRVVLGYERNVVWDHIAILPNGLAACSPDYPGGGCGITANVVNNSGETSYIYSSDKPWSEWPNPFGNHTGTDPAYPQSSTTEGIENTVNTTVVHAPNCWPNDLEPCDCGTHINHFRKPNIDGERKEDTEGELMPDKDKDTAGADTAPAKNETVTVELPAELMTAINGLTEKVSALDSEIKALKEKNATPEPAGDKTVIEPEQVDDPAPDANVGANAGKTVDKTKVVDEAGKSKDTSSTLFKNVMKNGTVGLPSKDGTFTGFETPSE